MTTKTKKTATAKTAVKKTTKTLKKLDFDKISSRVNEAAEVNVKAAVDAPAQEPAKEVKKPAAAPKSLFVDDGAPQRALSVSGDIPRQAGKNDTISFLHEILVLLPQLIGGQNQGSKLTYLTALGIAGDTAYSVKRTVDGVDNKGNPSRTIGVLDRSLKNGFCGVTHSDLMVICEGDEAAVAKIETAFQWASDNKHLAKKPKSED